MEHEHQFAHDLMGSAGVSKATNARVPSDDVSNLPCHASQGTFVDAFSLTSRVLDTMRLLRLSD